MRRSIGIALIGFVLCFGAQMAEAGKKKGKSSFDKQEEIAKRKKKEEKERKKQEEKTAKAAKEYAKAQAKKAVGELPTYRCRYGY